MAAGAWAGLTPNSRAPRGPRRPPPCTTRPILHEGDQADVGAVGLGHDGHHRGGARAGAPQRRRAGQHLPAGHQPADQARDRHHRQHADGEQQPVARARRRRSTAAPSWRSGSRRCPAPATKACKRQAHLAAARGDDDRRRPAAPASAPPAHAATAAAPPMPTDRTMSTATVTRPSRLMDYWTNSSASPFILRIVSDQLGGGRRQPCIIRAAQHQRDAGLAVAEGGVASRCRDPRSASAARPAARR